MILIGIFAPEVLVIAAVYKFAAPYKWHRLTRKYCKIWSVKHSWFAIMGGWRFGTNVPPAATTLRKSRVLWLLSQGLVDENSLPSRAEILDKSKASGLIKGLACLQTSWFVLRVSVICS